MSKLYNKICEEQLKNEDCDTCKIRMLCYKVERIKLKDITEEKNENRIKKLSR